MRKIEAGKLERKHKDKQVCKTRFQGSFAFVHIVDCIDIQFKKYFELFGCFKEHFVIFKSCFDFKKHSDRS